MLQAHTVYIKIYENRVEIRNVNDGKDISLAAETPFSTERLLVGSFTAAKAVLTRGVKIVVGKRLMALNILLHPMEKIEGGLSQVEDRVLRDLALSMGARKVDIWTGDDLSDGEVMEKAGDMQ